LLAAAELWRLPSSVGIGALLVVLPSSQS
jgi:hypothetical protein